MQNLFLPFRRRGVSVFSLTLRFVIRKDIDYGEKEQL